MNDTRYSGKGYNVCVGVCVWVREREKKKFLVVCCIPYMYVCQNAVKVRRFQ